MNFNQMFHNFGKTSVSANNALNNDVKNQKNKNNKTQVIDNQRGRNTRQFGSDITNQNNSLLIDGNNKYQCLKIDNKKKPLSRKASVSSKKTTKQKDLRSKKHLKGIPDVSVDNSAKNLKMEISNNSFGGSSMMLDEPVMTRNQLSEKLHNNPQMALEYLESIIATFYETEMNPYCKSFYPYANYMKIVQRDINDKMRVILFEWLIDVHFKWKLLPETLYLTFNIIDRFLGLKTTPRDELQCVGVAALLIACKYEEIYFPEITDFQEITDNAFSKQEILKKEGEILFVLRYDVTVPSPLRFFEAFNVYLKLETRDKAAVLYLLELCIFDYTMIKYKPSLVATGCLMLIIVNNKALRDILFFVSKYSQDDINLFLKDLIEVYNRPQHGSASLYRKYSHHRYYEIAKFDIIGEVTRLQQQNNAEN